MPDVVPQPKTIEDRVLICEAALQDYQQWRRDRVARDWAIVGSILTLAGLMISVLIVILQ